MRSIVFLFIIPAFFTISFFVALIAPKGKRKLLWLFVWFVVFFGDGFIVSAIFHCYGYLYGKINVYEKPAIRAYYAGEKKFDLGFPKANQFSSQDYTKDIAFTMLINGDLDYIDYRVQAKDSANNGKFFRMYVDNNTSNKCFMSIDEELKDYLSDKKIPYSEFKQLYDEYHSKPGEYKEIYYDAWFDNEERKKSYPQQQRIVVDKIIKIVQERYRSPNPINMNGKVFTWDDYQIKRVIDRLQDVDKKMEYYKQIYKDKCIARKEISKDEIAPTELIVEDPYHLLEPKPNIKTIFDNMLGMGFNYGGIIKDINTGKILADNIYIYESYHTWILQALVSALGPQSGGEFWMCNKNETNSIEKCNQKMIEEFFRKDRK